MPLFDLQCLDCNHEFTKIVSFHQLGGVECPKCQSNNHERVYKAGIGGPVSSNDDHFTPPTSGFS